jgi:ketosteroid isomerase-like protein
MRKHLDRRSFLRSATIGIAGAATWHSSARGEPFAQSGSPTLQSDQAQREEVEAFGRSLYEAKDSLDAPRFASHFAEPHIYQDAALSGHCGALATPQALQERYASGVFKRVGTPGKLCRFIHATGDTRYGVMAEVANLPKTFFDAPLGFDMLVVLEMKEGRICRNTDYWDSQQLGAALVPLHPDGKPRERPACTPNTLPGDVPHASKEMLDFARSFHDAMASGRADRVLRFFADDALFVHPLLHSGPPGYAIFLRGIQVRGKDAIGRVMKAALAMMPDGSDSALVNVIGGATGGGFEWKAGGAFARQGLMRDGIRGATSLDLFGGRIQRMSVKFDAMQMTDGQRAAVSSRLGR